MSWKKNKLPQNQLKLESTIVLEEPKLYPIIHITKPPPISNDDEFKVNQEMISIMRQSPFYINFDLQEPEMEKYSQKFYQNQLKVVDFDYYAKLPFIPLELKCSVKNTSSHSILLKESNNNEDDEDDEEQEQEIMDSEDSGDNDYGVDYYDDDHDAFGDDNSDHDLYCIHLYIFNLIL